MYSVDTLQCLYIAVISLASCCVLYLLSSHLSIGAVSSHSRDSVVFAPIISTGNDPSAEEIEVSPNQLSSSEPDSDQITNAEILNNGTGNKLKKRNSRNSKSTTTDSNNRANRSSIDDTNVAKRVSFPSDIQVTVSSVPTFIQPDEDTAAPAYSNNPGNSSLIVVDVPAPSLINSRNSSLVSLLKPSRGSSGKSKQSHAQKMGGKKLSAEVKYANEVRLIVEMGFSLEFAVEAIEKSLGNVDSAVSWILLTTPLSEASEQPIRAIELAGQHDDHIDKKNILSDKINVDEIDTNCEIGTMIDSPSPSQEHHVTVVGVTEAASDPQLKTVRLRHPINRIPQPCRHFSTRYGCRQGSQCKFSHDSSITHVRHDNRLMADRSANDISIAHPHRRIDSISNQKSAQLRKSAMVAGKPDNNSLIVDIQGKDRSMIDNRRGVVHGTARPRVSNADTSSIVIADGRDNNNNNSSASSKTNNDTSINDHIPGNNKWFADRHKNIDLYSNSFDKTPDLLAFVRKDNALGIVPAANLPRSPVIGPPNRSKSRFRDEDKEDHQRRDQRIDRALGSFSDVLRFSSDARRHSTDYDDLGSAIHPVGDAVASNSPNNQSFSSPSGSATIERRSAASRWFGGVTSSSSPIDVANNHFVYSRTGLVLQQEQRPASDAITTSNSPTQGGGHYIYVGGVLKPL